MTAPVVIGATTVTGTTAGPRVITPHASTAAGDIMFVLGSNIGTTATMTAPAGWTELKAHTIAGTSGLGCWAKVRVGGETTYSFPLSAAVSSAHACVTVRGGDLTAIVNGAIGTRAASGGTVTTTAPTITTSHVEGLALCFATERTTATETGITSVDNGFTEVVWSGTPFTETIWIGSKTLSAAGAVGATTVTYPNTQASNGLAFQVVLPIVVATCTDVLTEPFNNLTAWTVASGTATIVTGRTGTAAELSSSTTVSYTIGAINESDTVTVGFAYRATAITATTRRIIELWSDAGVTQHTRITHSGTDGSLAVTRGASVLTTSAVGLIALNTWYYIEVQAKLHDTAGFIIVRRNGVEVINTGLVDTKAAGTKTTIDTVRLALGASSNTSQYDDLYLSTGSACAFKGDPTLPVGPVGYPVKVYNGTSAVDAELFTTDGTDLIIPPAVLALPSAHRHVTIADMNADPMPMWAHRGGSINWVEFTMRAYTNAVFHGCKYLEVSVHRSSDGVFVMHHDANTVRMTGVNLLIGSTPWGTLAAMNQTNSGQPTEKIQRLEDLLDTYGRTHVIIIEDKTYANMGPMLDLIESFYGRTAAISRFIVKAYGGGGTTHMAIPNARGYSSWAYYYDAEATANAPTTQSFYTYLGLNWDATTTNWNALLAYGKKVLGFIIASDAQATTAISKGATGLQISNVLDVVPALNTLP